MDSNENRFSHVKVSGLEKKLPVPITSLSKPSISSEVTSKWQNILNITAEILDIPASLIMNIKENKIEVFLSGESDRNPYKAGESEKLGIGLYCETVVGKRSELLVPNALEDKNWDKNPDIKLNMISYYGLPVQWPDGEVFGTFCVLDNKTNHYSDSHKKLLKLLKASIEKDLELLIINDELSRSNLHKEILLKEIHHRIKNNFNMIISLLQLEVSSKSKRKKKFEDIVRDITARINTISMIHEKLYKSRDLANLDIKEYITDLSFSILTLYHKENIKLIINSQNISVDEKSLITCGLIINENITNSLKYAFTEVPNPTITVNIFETNDDYIQFEYYDNGIGLPDDFDITKNDSLGLLLINTLTKQLHGNLIVQTGKETKFIFTLKMQLRKQAGS